MKMKLLFTAIAMALLAGCATIATISTFKGSGTKYVFPANQTNVWNAAIAACQHGGISIVSYDQKSGFINAKTSARYESWGERIGVWVQTSSGTNTEVEVVSRRVGPADFFWYNWEKPILDDIAVTLNIPMPFVLTNAPAVITRSPHG
jgi:uncharacterized protein YceK